MNVNFKQSINQGKSLRFLKSNDGKKTLLKPVIIPSPFWQVTITGPYELTTPNPVVGGVSRAQNQASFNEDLSFIIYYWHLGCGDCKQMYYDFNLNKFVFREANIFYTKDFSTNITTDNWLRISDNVLVNLIGSGGTVSILPPS